MQRFFRTGIVGASAFLLGCATPNSSIVAPRTEPFSAPTVSQIRVDAGAKGWVFQSDGRTTTSYNLYFVKPQTLIRVGNFARYVQLEVRETPLRVADNWVLASVTTMQVDCSNRTMQMLNAEIFSDRAATLRVGTSATPLQPVPVRLGTAGDLVLLKACSGNFGVAAVDQTPLTPKAPGNSSGSGIILAKGAVVTNQHVVATCARIEVVQNGQPMSASVKKRDVKADLALLDVPTLVAGAYPSLRRRALNGEGVMVAGYPLSGFLSSDMIVTDGIVNALSGISNDSTLLQISAPVQAGNSGGPLIDKSGAVLGVVVSKLNALRAAAATGDLPQNINFAIKPEVLRRFLESENLSVNSVDGGSRLETEVLAERARAFTLKVECKN
jgi:S1-C subfamily serine protease